MLLEKYRGDHYKSVENSGEILVHKKITRMVGQNEAGKTALLELLNTLRPIGGTPSTFVVEDYPRSKFNQYKRTHDESAHTPVRAEFALEADEIKQIEDEFGLGVLATATLSLSKRYGDSTLYYSLDVNEPAYIKHFTDNLELDSEIKEVLKKSKTIKELQGEFLKLNAEHQALAKKLPQDLKKEIFNRLPTPHFFYFDEYATLPGEISLKKLKEFAAAKNYTGDDAESLRTAKALIDFAGAEIDEFLNKDNYERLKADLEAASNEITDQLRRFWTTNQNLEIRFDLQPKLNDQNQLLDTVLHIRVYNIKHRVTVPFRKRSKGFVWFFSFLVAFSEHKARDGKIVLLLDEPGLNLGAIAQRDLMRYFEQELAPHHQILYTTHSPFMIDPRQLETVRTVEDEESQGTRVSNDPCQHSSETLFPLQAALGYDLSQTLFVAPNNLLVEGPGDLVFFNLATQLLKQGNRTGLDDRWTVVPVGGADKIASFVSLLGAQGLNLAVFMDVSSSDQQRFQSILKNKLMLKKSLITVGSVLGRQEADVEDLFSTTAYLNLVSRSYANELNGKAISLTNLSNESPRVVKKLEAYFAAQGINKGKFSHYKPAYDLMCNPSWLSDVFDAETKANFEKAFSALNQALEAIHAEQSTTGLPVKRLRERSASKPAEITA